MSGSIAGRDMPGDGVTWLFAAPDESGLPARFIGRCSVDRGLYPLLVSRCNHHRPSICDDCTIVKAHKRCTALSFVTDHFFVVVK